MSGPFKDVQNKIIFRRSSKQKTFEKSQKYYFVEGSAEEVQHYQIKRFLESPKSNLSYKTSRRNVLKTRILRKIPEILTS